MIRILFLALILIPSLTHASCNTTLPLYKHFKNYRMQLNHADQFEQLSIFFSKRFNRYYQDKINKAGRLAKQRYINQYWDNLGIGQDIIIVYDYRVVCIKQRPALQLTAVLDNKTTLTKSAVDLWKITVHFRNENHQWLIEQLEYEISRSQKQLSESSIKDNFLILND